MRRDYIDSMKADGFGEFLTACENLRNCKFVIAETKITALLKAIADNKQLYSMFGMALYGFDYELTFSECISTNNIFSLPTEPKKAIALVFRILLDIDAGKMPLQNFLSAYFHSASLNESYARFCLEILAPFERYCRSLFAQADALKDVAALRDEKVASSLRADAKNCVNIIIEIANAEISATIERAEFAACVKGLTRALDSNDYDQIISSFLGVKYGVAYFFKSSKTVLDIFKKLEYDIKHLAD
ncbi:MAG: hypothetical protein HDT28_03695 [Clostridiales bacterium]|nr:hypothetical protein [Clostridiales bacterium]